MLPSVWPVPRSLATTCGIAFAFSSSPYLDVSVQEVPLPYLLIQYGMPKLYFGGLLHSDICGSLPAYGSPQHFVVCHVLHRLPVPRHSPCALLSLTFKLCVLSLDLIVVFFTHFFFLIFLLISKKKLALILFYRFSVQFSRFSFLVSFWDTGGLKWT